MPAVAGAPEIPAGGRAIRARPGGSYPARIDHLQGWTLASSRSTGRVSLA